MGYSRAGFEVVGVDIAPQPNYPFEFHQGDALEYLAEHGHEFDAIHASPPCQDYTEAQKLQGNTHPRLVNATRLMLYGLNYALIALAFESKIPWVIENVVGAPLIDPIMLCGSMFGLHTYRHRLFESNVPLFAPQHPEHKARQTKMGRPPVEGEFMHVVGNFSGCGASSRGHGDALGDS